MRKIATLFVLMITFSMVFAGAVSAAEVDTVVLDENDDPVVVACPGDEVIVDTYVEINETDDPLIVPDVIIDVDPANGLLIDPDNAMMTTDGINWIFNDDPLEGGFFTWDAVAGVGVWTLGIIMTPDSAAELIIPAVVSATGPITVEAIFEGNVYDPETQEFIPVIVGVDTYTFLSVPCGPCPHGQTVPMQATGSPLAVAALGLLSIIGGAVYGKLR